MFIQQEKEKSDELHELAMIISWITTIYINEAYKARKKPFNLN
jgi:hypothetical protein